jgi:hypothetical protein
MAILSASPGNEVWTSYKKTDSQMLVLTPRIVAEISLRNIYTRLFRRSKEPLHTEFLCGNLRENGNNIPVGLRVEMASDHFQWQVLVLVF